MSSPSTESQEKSLEGQSDEGASMTAERHAASEMKGREESAATSVNSKEDGKKNDKPPVNKPDTTITAPKESSKKTDNPKPIKIKVHLVAVGSAPILKKSKFLMNADDRFAVAIAFLRKVLKLSSSGTTSTASISSLFLYVNAAFVPSPDERMGDLFDCFGSRGELVIHYSLQEAWG
mmetsp:Transcript_4240/g.9622  ORF Transcript_4240/g.9622 Transcript_4240/m.9622 type:complete len:177 (-) Transcript_4240:395-925(-)